jgi:hypothetical protein
VGAVAREVVASMARSYVSNSIDVVTEAFATPGDYPTWEESFGDTTHKTFILLPPLVQVLARNNEREVKAADVTQNYAWSEGWKNVENVIVLENSKVNPKQTADKIISSII